MNYSIDRDIKTEDLPACEFCQPFSRCSNEIEAILLLRFGRSDCRATSTGSYPYKVLAMLLPRYYNWSAKLDVQDYVRWIFPELSRLRLLILVRVLEVIAITRLTDFRTLAHLCCIRKLCKVVSEPFITTQEIRTFLCDAMECDESNELIQEICSEFWPYVQPIRLKELCRSVIHHALRKAGTHPDDASKLVILPKKLQEFISQKCDYKMILCTICICGH